MTNKATKTVFIMMIFTFGSKLLGLIREMLIAAKFGSGAETDSFFIALTAISLFTIMLTQAINTTTIPLLSEVEANEGKVGKENSTINLLNIVFFISIILAIVGWIIAPLIIKLLAYGFNDEQYELTVFMMRIGLPALIFAGVVGVFRGYLQSESRFTETAASQFPYNFVYIFFLILLGDTFGIIGLMVTSVLAVGSQILLQIPGIRKVGFRYKFFLDIKSKYIKKAAFLVPPVLLSVAVNDVNKLVDKSLASTLIEGSISALNYGNYLKDLVLGVFITTIVSVMFPILSKEANKEKNGSFKNVMANGINYILLITIPATVGVLVLAEPLVRIAFERGAFTSYATNMTAEALIFYSLGFAGMGLRIFLDRVYYSLQDTRTPMINGFIAVGLNIILNLILVNFMEHRGLALATSISATITSLLLLIGLRKKVGSIGLIRNIIVGIKSVGASVVMGVLIYFIYSFFENYLYKNILVEISAILISGFVGLIVYFIFLYLFKVNEIDVLLNLIKKKFYKKVKK